MRLKSLVVMFVCGWSAVARAEGDRPTFPSGVELITVDAVVVDKKGEPVAGLTAADFVIKEDGQVREIDSFEAFALPSSLPDSSKPPATPAPVASNEAPTPEAARRAVALVVDDLAITPAESKEVRRALTAFIDKSLAEGDLVSYATTSGDAAWSTRFPEGREDLLALVGRFKGHQRLAEASIDYMSDYEAFSIATETGDVAQMTARVVARWQATGACVTPSGFGTDPACPHLVRARAVNVDAERRQRSNAVLATVRRSTAAVAEARGRKSLLLFSPGFVEDPQVDLRDVIAASREANTAVYFFDVRGLMALRTGQGSAADAGPAPDPRNFLAMSVETNQLDSAGAENLADETGGLSVRHSNDLAGRAVRVGEESRIFYLLGFHPQSDKKPEDWRKLKVEVKRDGLTVRARRGYNLRRPADETPRSAAHAKDVSPAVVRALDSVVEAPAIPLRAMTYVLEPHPKDTARVLVAVEMDARHLQLDKVETGRVAQLEISVLATHRDSSLALRADRRAEVRVAGGQEAAWRTVTQEFDLPAGVSQIRVAVRDLGSKALGTISQRVEVPDGKTLRLSTPIVSDQIDRSNKAHPSAVMAVHRVFPAKGALFCQYEVFGAKSGGKKAPPRVAASFALRAPDGRVVRQSEASPITADANGRLVRLVGMGIDDLPEGQYELAVSVKDEVAGSVVEHKETITLSRASG
jgi:VWFA-related protein